MYKKITSYLMIITLTFLVLPLTFHQKSETKIDNTLISNYTDSPSENIAEANYIQSDTLLTAEINLKPFVNMIRKDLLKSVTDTQALKKKYPELIEITKTSTYYNNLPFLKMHKDTKKNFSIENIDEEEVTMMLPIRSKETTDVYQIKIKSDFFSQIEKKQQLRMFTVTNLNSEKWHTKPTRYTAKKKLSLDFRESLPDINPDISEKGISHYIDREVLIKYKNGIDDLHLHHLLNKYHLQIVKRNNTTVIVKCLDKSTKDIIKMIENAELNQDTLIEYVEPHFIYLTNQLSDDEVNAYSLIPNDTLYLDYQWNLPMIYTSQAWNLSRGKKNVVIAVVDTGVDIEHPEFQGRLVEGINILDPSKPPKDDDGHGTHVAGIISANTNNEEGIAGITWYNKIMPIKVLDQSGAGTLFDVAEGIIWATDHGAKVINLSLGNYAESKYLEDAIKYAYSKDVVLIAATGNDNTDQMGYPAAYSEVIGVAAIDFYQDRANFSNYGSYVDVVAPGVNIPSTYPHNQYASLSGTSMAAPHVSGLAGLIRAYNPKLSNEKVYQIIRNTATDLGSKGKDDYYGYGEINVIRALESVNQPKSPNILLNWLKDLMKLKYLKK